MTENESPSNLFAYILTSFVGLGLSLIQAFETGLRISILIITLYVAIVALRKSREKKDDSNPKP